MLNSTGAAIGRRPVVDGVVLRRLPTLTPDTGFFWHSGKDGVLRIARCGSCGFYVHPPSPWCPRCLTATAKPTEVSGRAVVETFTVNYEPWEPDLTEPYLVAIVSLIEQPSVRLTTNIVNCGIDEARFGMRVRVLFERQADIYLPLFEPDTDDDGARTEEGER